MPIAPQHCPGIPTAPQESRSVQPGAARSRRGRGHFHAPESGEGDYTRDLNSEAAQNLRPRPRGQRNGRNWRGSERAGGGKGADTDWPPVGLEPDPSKWASRGREQRSERGSPVRGSALSADWLSERERPGARADGSPASGAPGMHQEAVRGPGWPDCVGPGSGRSAREAHRALRPARLWR